MCVCVSLQDGADEQRDSDQKMEASSVCANEVTTTTVDSTSTCEESEDMHSVEEEEGEEGEEEEEEEEEEGEEGEGEEGEEEEEEEEEEGEEGEEGEGEYDNGTDKEKEESGNGRQQNEGEEEAAEEAGGEGGGGDRDGESDEEEDDKKDKRQSSEEDEEEKVEEKKDDETRAEDGCSAQTEIKEPTNTESRDDTVSVVDPADRERAEPEDEREPARGSERSTAETSSNAGQESSMAPTTTTTTEPSEHSTAECSASLVASERDSERVEEKERELDLRTTSIQLETAERESERESVGASSLTITDSNQPQMPASHSETVAMDTESSCVIPTEEAPEETIPNSPGETLEGPTVCATPQATAEESLASCERVLDEAKCGEDEEKMIVGDAEVPETINAVCEEVRRDSVEINGATQPVDIPTGTATPSNGGKYDDKVQDCKQNVGSAPDSSPVVIISPKTSFLPPSDRMSCANPLGTFSALTKRKFKQLKRVRTQKKSIEEEESFMIPIVVEVMETATPVTSKKTIKRKKRLRKTTQVRERGGESEMAGEVEEESDSAMGVKCTIRATPAAKRAKKAHFHDLQQSSADDSKMKTRAVSAKNFKWLLINFIVFVSGFRTKKEGKEKE